MTFCVFPAPMVSLSGVVRTNPDVLSYQALNTMRLWALIAWFAPQCLLEGRIVYFRVSQGM
jgi:hypothetical protein